MSSDVVGRERSFDSRMNDSVLDSIGNRHAVPPSLHKGRTSFDRTKKANDARSRRRGARLFVFNARAAPPVDTITEARHSSSLSTNKCRLLPSPLLGEPRGVRPSAPRARRGATFSALAGSLQVDTVASDKPSGGAGYEGSPCQKQRARIGAVTTRARVTNGGPLEAIRSPDISSRERRERGDSSLAPACCCWLPWRPFTSCWCIRSRRRSTAASATPDDFGSPIQRGRRKSGCRGAVAAWDRDLTAGA
jgi:hypothetical protein